ncbi:hypothetical protein K493DRAFT_407920 [Basidiobolus meristosporus CBS 931.73]|uniref:4-aminobutyrate aminotransferase n=1 Tax=Basidiobolus meristosporus CBS 931.73 TaxID=1314790 RepID=A0A1Y1Y9F9_9FUNG|nr:hypothetical protein K493DRAFT_407920 [Basidiobolus meristosporus CBS 931.73]|eukprot:ORX94623.1 hypothetical protein K493DRAFT_407920 [Basidiobolus meristosporus CBS 931.73]
MASSNALRTLGLQHIARGVGRSTNLVISKASGSYVYTVEGKKYLDLTTGIGVTSTGHCHPKVVKAAQEQVGKLVHGQVNLFFHEPMVKLIEKLKPIMPSKQLDTFFFWNSGAEAVEAAIKLARHATGKHNIIVMQGSYHGRTVGTMSLTTSKTIYSAGFGPLMPGVYVTPFPYTLHSPTQKAVPQDTLRHDLCIEYAIEQLELLLKQQTAPSDTAALIMESVLGEGGYVVPPKEYVQRVREICDKHGILLIADEVQSGFGRTGKYFAIQHADVVPDIMVMAKGIASGFPISGIVSRKELMDKQPPGSMGGTYSGNAVSCAAAIATLEVMEEENLLKNVQERSKEIFSRLNNELVPLLQQHDIKVDVRGLGLMIGVEFYGNGLAGLQKKLNSKVSDAVAGQCYQNDMLVLTTSVYDTIRLIPALNITKEESAIALDTLIKSAKEVLN